MNNELKEVTAIPVFESAKKRKKRIIKEIIIKYLKDLKDDFNVAMDEIVCDGIIKKYGLVKDEK